MKSFASHLSRHALTRCAATFACLVLAPAGFAQEAATEGAPMPSLSATRALPASVCAARKSRSRVDTPLPRRRPTRQARRIELEKAPCARLILACFTPPCIDDRLATSSTRPCHARADWQQRLMAALLDRTRA